MKPVPPPPPPAPSRGTPSADASVKRPPLRRVALSRRDVLKALPVIGTGAALAGLSLSRPAHASVVASECRFCTTHCGIHVHTENGRVMRVEGDPSSATQGFVCIHGRALPEIVEHKGRLLRPLIRRGDHFEQVDFDTAIAHAAGLIAQAQRAHGAPALAVQTGWPFVRHPLVWLLHRFCRALGTPNLVTVASLCEASNRMGGSLVFGTGMHPELGKAKSLWLWGTNPEVSYPLSLQSVGMMKKKGRLVVVDPVRTDAAAGADLHLQVQPGQDGVLALALMRVLFEENLCDSAFLAGNATGVDALRTLALERTVDDASRLCGISASTIAAAARMFIADGPTALWSGLGVEHQRDGVNVVRLLASLCALGGFTQANGIGAVRSSGADGIDEGDSRIGGDTLALELAVEMPEPVPPAPSAVALGSDAHPLFCAVHHQAHGSALPRAITRGEPYPLRALVVFGANPLVTTPNTAELSAAWDQLDALIVVDGFLTESAQRADVVFPPASFVEQPRLADLSGAEDVPVTPPRDVRTDGEILFALARALGQSAYFPWTSLPEALSAQRVRVADSNSVLVRAADATARTVPTRSGLVELVSTVVPAVAPDGDARGVPVVRGPAPLSDAFPVRLVTGPRPRGGINSQLRRAASVARIAGPAAARMHADTAAQARLTAGAAVRVVTATGSAVFAVELTDTVVPGVVVVPSGYEGESNANRLTSWTDADPLSGFPPFRGLCCRLEPA